MQPRVLALLRSARVVMWTLVVSAPTFTAFAAEISRETEAQAVREVALKIMINDQIAAREGYQIYFLAVDTGATNNTTGDPSDEFMKRFDRYTFVKKASESKTGEKGEVRDKSTGKLGVILTVSGLKWLSDEKAEIICNFYKAGLHGHSERFTLVRTRNRWKVTNKQLLTIS